MANVAKYGDAWKYDNVSWKGLVTASAILVAADRSRQELHKALAIRTLLDTDEFSMPKHTAGEYIKSHVKANEIQHTDLEGFGEEWVGIAYDSVYWEDVNERSRILSLIPQTRIGEKANEMRVPVQAGDPQFFGIGEATGQTGGDATDYTELTAKTSRVGTAFSTVPVRKLGSAVTWSGELQEDAVVDFADAVRTMIRKEAAHVIDDLIINGDSATGTDNINNDGTALASDNPLLLLDGFRKYALADTSRQQDVGGTLGPANIARTLRIAGSDSVDVDDLVVVVPVRTHESLLTTSTEADRVNVFDFMRRESGEWRVLGGYRYVPTPDFTRGSALTAANGKVSDTASNNTRLSSLAVRPDQWLWGNKRSMMLDVKYRGRADVYEITSNARIALAHRSGTNTAAALAFNGE